MTYRKFKADHLFDGYNLHGNDKVLLTAADGTIDAIVNESEAGDNIETFEGILSPGLINCHCHLELSHMKGLIPQETGLVDFVFKVVTERHLSEETITAAIAEAETAMYNTGIVAVGDICNNLSTLPQKQQGKLAYYNFIETSGWLPAVANDRFKRSFEFYTAFGKIQNSKFKIQNSLSPHAPYSVSPDLWELMRPYFNGKTITIHNQETAFEDELFTQGTGDFARMYEMMKLDTSFFQPTGTSSLRSYLPKMDNAEQVMLVHNTFTTENDLLYAKTQHANLNWCLCINANLYIEKAVPPVDLLRRNDAHIVIGTDSLASNHELNILSELKTIHTHFPAVPLTELLQWATRNGAQALQLSDRLGSFETGKTPGIVLITGLENGQLTQHSSAKNLCNL